MIVSSISGWNVIDANALCIAWSNKILLSQFDCVLVIISKSTDYIKNLRDHPCASGININIYLLPSLQLTKLSASSLEPSSRLRTDVYSVVSSLEVRG